MALEPGQYTRREPGSASASLLYPADVFCAKTDGSFYDTERACGRDVSVRVRRICAKRTRHNVGDDTFLTLRNRYAGLSGPAPHALDGKPDLSGIWNGSPDPNPEQASVLPWAATLQKQRIGNNLKELPSAYCLPGEVFPGAPLPYKIVQTPSLVVQLFEGGFRQVFLDGGGHPQDPDPTWRGHSIGRWEGDTLLIDTVGFNDKAWLPAFLPHTEQLHVVERYHRPDLAHLNIDVSIEDPGTFTKPWQLHMVWTLAPGEEIGEFICENNKYFGDTRAK